MRDESPLSPSPSNDRLGFERRIPVDAYVWIARTRGYASQKGFQAHAQRSRHVNKARQALVTWATARAHVAAGSIDLKHRFCGVSATLRGAHWLDALRTHRQGEDVVHVRSVNVLWGIVRRPMSSHAVLREK
jgi:hypothetical protein